MFFNNCNGLGMYNLRHLNSPRNHISLSCSKNIHVWGLRLIAPGDSPNTDGSLGENGEFATVEEVRVKNCTFTNTQNGVRIKTFQANGSGYARKISFEDINMVASENPVIIDQKYNNHGSKNGRLNSYQSSHLTSSLGEARSKSVNGKGVKVSDVRYTRIHGSSASDQAITLNCDADLGCANIVMDHVNMVSATSGHKVFASCNNAHGSYVSSLASCLTKG
ncbi:unnamed protein product [Arabis nemorensis]|uniref:Pectate lyase domain-containing protein n=1 Tax=Arabis nemorensis TaxID=586526 RepID=A0A565CMV1_9BRAS|nr:unnamed protein product [Arabis nemorensis]